jgi:hypothetical protein
MLVNLWVHYFLSPISQPPWYVRRTCAYRSEITRHRGRLHPRFGLFLRQGETVMLIGRCMSTRVLRHVQ